MRILIVVSETKDDRTFQSTKIITMTEWRAYRFPGEIAEKTINIAITEVEQEMNNA
jgi:hypothetical protein